MKRTTKKLTGVGLEVFLRRLYGAYPGIDEELAERLARDGLRTFASVRVRGAQWRDWRGRSRPLFEKTTAGSQVVRESGPEIDEARGPSGGAAPTIGAAEDAAPFDPYAIGLVPTYQREGPAGLLAKLGTVTSVDHLRKMARTQQVPLPAGLRGGEGDINAIRAAIVEAVGKRIANRRAAAG